MPDLQVLVLRVSRIIIQINDFSEIITFRGKSLSLLLSLKDGAGKTLPLLQLHLFNSVKGRSLLDWTQHFQNGRRRRSYAGERRRSANV